MNYPPDDNVPLVDTLCQGYGTSQLGGVAWISTLKIGCMVVQIIRAPDVAHGSRLAPYGALPSLRPMWPSAEPIKWPLPRAIPYELMMALAHPEVFDVTVAPIQA
ncbi:hypothetical protein [Streptomyces sp. SAS_270]|uniref:hypothetical protein n=1 Tax=Streptomyces sp. SAS_270 TaxID=3412748 RepID=UPI00403D1E3E